MHSIRNIFNIKHAVLAVAAAGLLLSALVMPVNSAYAQESINDVDVTDREELMDLLNSLLERVAELRAQLDEQRGSSDGDGFEIGDEVTTTSRLSVREEPAGVRLAVAEAGDTATVIDGPVQLDGYTWWKLKFSYGTPTMTNLTGWSAGAWLVSENEVDDDDDDSSYCEIAKFATVEAWEAACGDEEDDDDIIARVIISDVTTEGDGVHGDGIMLGDGTVIGNGDWFAITDDGTYVDDDTTVTELDDIEDFEGLAVVRDGIGGVTIGHVGMNSSESDRESTEGRIVFENGTLIEESIDTVDFEDHGNYNDEYGTDFDYTDLRSATRLAFGTLVATGRDEIVMRVQFGGDDSDDDDLMDDEANDDDEDDEVVEGDWDVWDIREVYYQEMATEFLQLSEDVDSNGEEIDVNKDYIVYYIYLEDTDTKFERLVPQFDSDIKVIACTSCDDEEFYDAFYAEGMGGTEESIEYLKDLAKPIPSPNEAAGCDGNEVWSAQIGWCVEGAGSGGSER